MNDMFNVTDKVLLITGGSRGLGKAMALEFGRRGAKVVIASRKIEECEKVAEQVRMLGSEALAIACHVGEWHNLEKVVDRVVQHFGRLDLLINNAGMSPLAPSLFETSESLFDKIIDINLKGPTRLTALAATKMAETGGGCIVNISSLASQKPSPMTTIYSTAKAGLNALTLATAQEYASVNVRVNCIVSGTFETDATAGFVKDGKVSPEMTKRIALARIGQPKEIVGTALYLCSEASSYTTGACINVDGGVRP